MWVRSYGRKSRALGDPDDPAVVAHQLAACDRWAAERSLVIPAEGRIAEVGSGESISGRPRFLALLQELESDPPADGGLLFVTEVARLSRAEMDEVGRIIRAFRHARVRPVIAGREYDLRSPDDELFFTHMAVYARHEVARFKWRVELKMQKQLEEGAVRLAAKPWGYLYDRNQKRLVPHPDQFPILVACCREIRTTGIRQLARKYGVPASTLSTALSNPAICGWPSVHWENDPRRPGRSRRLPRSRWRWAGRQNDSYPHACSRELFDANQALMADRKKRGLRTVGTGGWCRDVLQFAECPGRVRLSSCRIGSRGAATGAPVYERREDGKRLAFIERETVHAAVERFLVEQLGRPDTAGPLLAAYRERKRKAKVAGGNDPLARLADCQRRYQQTVDAEFDADGPLQAALHTRRLRLEAELADLQAEVEARARIAGEALDTGRLVEGLLKAAALLPRVWPTWEESRKRAIVNAFLERVEVEVERGPSGRITGRWIGRIVPQPWFR